MGLLNTVHKLIPLDPDFSGFILHRSSQIWNQIIFVEPSCPSMFWQHRQLHISMPWWLVSPWSSEHSPLHALDVIPPFTGPAHNFRVPRRPPLLVTRIDLVHESTSVLDGRLSPLVGTALWNVGRSGLESPSILAQFSPLSWVSVG